MNTDHINVITGNFGNQTIAAMQWARDQSLKSVHVVSVETGWAAPLWQNRVEEGEQFARLCGFTPVRLSSKLSFQDLMRDRGAFPTTKFQWCAAFLKGLPLLDWLDEVDPGCEATIILGKRRADSRANLALPEVIAESEYYGDRKVWHPLYDCDDPKFFDLIQKAGFNILEHRSLECDPCVNSVGHDLSRISKQTLCKTADLERELGKTMFEKPIAEMVAQLDNKKNIDMFTMGCGSPYACGE